MERLRPKPEPVRVVRLSSFVYSGGVQCQRAELPLKLDGVAAARSFFAACFAKVDLREETLWVAHLDGEANCLHLSRHQGDSCSIALPLRIIVVDAARHRSSAILLAHNHPSGDCLPSDADLSATRRLAITTEALGCRLADHLIFGASGCASLRNLGYV